MVSERSDGMDVPPSLMKAVTSLVEFVILLGFVFGEKGRKASSLYPTG